MKTCSKCNIQKSENEFFYQDKHAKKLHAQCKVCYIGHRRKTWEEHYHKYGSKYRERALERNRKYKVIRRMQLLEYLSDKSCAICGINDPRVLEFDHIDPATKSFGIAQGLSSTLNWETILDEISKCQILCANCHKIKTAKQQDWYKNLKTLA
jgi:5-methylcytosine-specific restriction endonuclease McrA